MINALLIGPEQIRDINAAVERARKRPIPWRVLKAAMPGGQDTDVVTLADREPVEHIRPESECIELPANYRLCVSFEEQPAGLCMHVSVSINRLNRLPHPAAVAALLRLCVQSIGNPDIDSGRNWIEEFLVDGEPGGLAANAVFLVAPAQAGHA
jgi:hypothetical protein